MYCVLILGILLAVAQAVGYYHTVHLSDEKVIREFMVQKDLYGMGNFPDNVYESFLGGERFTFFSEIYFSILPILAVLPYGMSCFDDRKSGYADQVICRVGYKTYCISKLIASFLIGGFAVLFPYVLSFLITAQIYPMDFPNVQDGRSAITGRSLLINYYYVHPLLYALAYVLILFMIGGILAMMASLACYYLRIRLAILFAPYIFYSVQLVVFERFGILPWAFKPLAFQSGYTRLEDVSYPEVLLYLLAHILIIGGLFIWKTRKIETTTLS